MKFFFRIILAAYLLSLPLTAMAGDGETLGTLVGAGAGGIIGNQFGHGGGKVAATVGGVFVGGLVGNSIGASADHASAMTYGQPGYYNGYAVGAAPVYYSTNYVPNYVAPPAPPPTYIDEDSGSYCREYSQTVRIDGHMQESYGTACLQPDGSWRVVD